MIFLTKRSLNKYLDKREKQKKWEDFFHSEKVGFTVVYQGISFEVVEESDDFFHGVWQKKVCLKVGDQTIDINLCLDDPLDIKFRYR